jgi:hypothetical protein
MWVRTLGFSRAACAARKITGSLGSCFSASQFEIQLRGLEFELIHRPIESTSNTRPFSSHPHLLSRWLAFPTTLFSADKSVAITCVDANAPCIASSNRATDLHLRLPWASLAPFSAVSMPQPLAPRRLLRTTPPRSMPPATTRLTSSSARIRV